MQTSKASCGLNRQLDVQTYRFTQVRYVSLVPYSTRAGVTAAAAAVVSGATAAAACCTVRCRAASVRVYSVTLRVVGCALCSLYVHSCVRSLSSASGQQSTHSCHQSCFAQPRVMLDAAKLLVYVKLLQPALHAEHSAAVQG